jgi:hypothetical protein
MTEGRHTIGLFGDSIACGLGVKSLRYIDLVRSRTDSVLYDFALSGATLSDSWSRYLKAGAPTLQSVVIAHGITEPIPRPKAESIKFLPDRWQRLGWMDPRPYYSSHLRRRVLEKIESATRWRVKNLMIRLHGPEFLQDLDSYLNILGQALEHFHRHGTQVILLEPTAIDGRYFPGAPEAQGRYWQAARELAGGAALETHQFLHEWDDFFADHFHPNARGHEKLAGLIQSRLV